MSDQEFTIYKQPIQVRVCQVLKSLIDRYPSVFSSRTAKLFQSFIQNELEDKNLHHLKVILLNAIEERVRKETKKTPTLTHSRSN